MSGEAKNHLIYIMGPGRSGSTVLGILLRNGLVDCEFYGELYAWAKYGGVPRNERETVEVFWKEFQEQNPGLLEYSREPFHRRLEHYSRLLFGLIPGQRLKKRYRAFNRSFFEALAKSGQQSIMVDSSHYPFRAWELRQLEDVQLHLIYLFRDPGASLRSFATRDIEQQQKGRGAALLYLLSARLFCTWIYHRFPREDRLRICFEDLQRNPRGVLASVADHFHLERADFSLENLDTGLILEGNRIKESNSIRFRTKEIQKEGGFLDRLLRLLFLPLR